MINKRGKRAQFYLIAAIFIVMIIITILSVRTYIVAKPEPRKLQDISSELSEEGARIVDHGIYTDSDLEIILNTFDTDYGPYFLKKTDATNIVFIYGDKDDLYSVQYKEGDTGTVSATIGSWGVESTIPGTISVREKIKTKDSDTGLYLDTVEVEILGKTFEFDLRDNEMFYFLLTQEKEGDIYVERN